MWFTVSKRNGSCYVKRSHHEILTVICTHTLNVSIKKNFRILFSFELILPCDVFAHSTECPNYRLPKNPCFMLFLFPTSFSSLDTIQNIAVLDSVFLIFH